MLTRVTETVLAPPARRLAYRAFMEEHVYPNEAAIAREDDAALALVAELQAKAKEAGLWAPHLPPEAGGSGEGFLDYAQLNEEIGRSTYAQLVFGCQAPDAGNGEILWLFGTEEQQRRFLQPLVAGEVRSFFSMTEPDVAGSDPTLLQTRAVRDGDDWVIDGTKWFSSGAEGRRVRDRHGGHRPRGGAAPPRDADPRPGRHARGRGRAPDPDDGPPGPRLVDALRGAVHGRPRAGREHARRARRRLPHRAEAPRPGPHPPRDALARPDAARVRAHVRVRPAAARRSGRASPTSRPSRTGSPTRPPRSRGAG